MSESLRDEISRKVITERILSAFTGPDISITDVAKVADLIPSTAGRHLRRLEREGLVVHTRNIGKAAMFDLVRK